MADDPLSRSPVRIAGMFDAIAGHYDFLNHVLSAGIDRYWRRRAIRSLGLRGGETVLDLCTGTADVAMSLARAVPGVRVVGVDFAGGMLAIGQQKLVRAGLTRTVGLVRGDAMRIPLPDRSVDAVTMAFGIRNVERPDVACADIVRVLKPGGRLAILEFGTPTLPGVRGLYLWYFRHVLPRIGGLVSRDAAAYSYLPASVGAFPPPAEFLALLERAGFVGTRADSLSVGIVYLYQGRTKA